MIEIENISVTDTIRYLCAYSGYVENVDDYNVALWKIVKGVASCREFNEAFEEETELLPFHNNGYSFDIIIRTKSDIDVDELVRFKKILDCDYIEITAAGTKYPEFVKVTFGIENDGVEVPYCEDVTKLVRSDLLYLIHDDRKKEVSEVIAAVLEA
jgi:hypothetical protein